MRTLRANVIRLAYTYPSRSYQRRQLLALLQEEFPTVSTGDILHSSFGRLESKYSAGIPFFYEVLATTPKMVQIRPLEERVVRRRVLPVPGRYSGPVMRKRIFEIRGRPAVKLTGWSSAILWDGSPKPVH